MNAWVRSLCSDTGCISLGNRVPVQCRDPDRASLEVDLVSEAPSLRIKVSPQSTRRTPSPPASVQPRVITPTATGRTTGCWARLPPTYLAITTKEQNFDLSVRHHQGRREVLVLVFAIVVSIFSP